MTRLKYAAKTDPGRERELNEDRVWAQVFEASEGGPMGLFIVCDGLGGHLGGEVASHWGVEAIKHELADVFIRKDPRATVRLTDSEVDLGENGVDATRLSSSNKIESQVILAIQKANVVVRDVALKNPERAADAGTTVTMAIVFGMRAIIANVGDSRTYLLRDGELRQVTRDHSLVASLVENEQIKPEEIYSHPQRNIIFRSLGQKRQVQVDTFWEVMIPGDYLLLCSDGLWEMVRDKNEITRIIKETKSLDRAAEKLIDAANAAGGEDNISVILVKFS
jgi:serine/threonine protein phosphatase PrpC